MNASILMICLAGTAVVGQGKDTVFKAPGIEVRRGMDAEKDYAYLLYNRVYLGRQYHKSQKEPDLHRLPTTYFHDKSPIGIVLRDPKWFPKKDAPPVAVLGMDIGTIAAYAEPGQTIHFTERVPTFVKLSMPDKGKDRHFTFVQDAIDRGAKVKIFEGEPREMLEKHGPDKFYKVIVIETYKLPVIEVHKELLTKEALQLLMSKLRDDGIVCFHTSNRYYQMAPVIASAANELKLACIVGKDQARFDARRDDFRFSSEWVMVARDKAMFANFKKDENNQIEWSAPKRTRLTRGRFSEDDVKTQYLWTDKGEQSFRGLYYSDPEIDKLQEVLSDIQQFLDSAGISYRDSQRFTEPVRGLIRAWSGMSADRMNKEPAPKDEKK